MNITRRAVLTVADQPRIKELFRTNEQARKLVNRFVAGESLDATTWNDGSPAFYAGALILQMASAAVGARLGSRQPRAMTTGS